MIKFVFYILLVAARRPLNRDRHERIMDSKGLVIVAVGLPGAGKSRFHEKFLPDAVRCCQDLLKRREKVEALVEETVRAGKVAYARRSVEINDAVSIAPYWRGTLDV